MTCPNLLSKYGDFREKKEFLEIWGLWHICLQKNPLHELHWIYLLLPCDQKSAKTKWCSQLHLFLFIGSSFKGEAKELCIVFQKECSFEKKWENLRIQKKEKIK
jgi:hypothetical protein